MGRRKLPSRFQLIAKKFKALPSPLSVTAIVFGIIPLGSVLFLNPWQVLHQATGWQDLTLFFNFWVGPAALSVCAFTRHKLLLPLFLIECGTILLNTMFSYGSLSSHTLFLQAILIGSMLLFAYFLLRKDALYPLMHETSRAWRGSPRIHVGHRVAVSIAGQLDVVPVMLQNWSTTGMEIAGKETLLKFLLSGKAKHDQFDFTLTLNRKSWDFSSEIAWSYEEDGERRLGLHVADEILMAALYASIPKEQPPILVRAFDRSWQSKPFRQFALSLWAVLVFAVFFVPVAKKHIAFRTNASSNSPLYMKAGLGPVFRGN